MAGYRTDLCTEVHDNDDGTWLDAFGYDSIVDNGWVVAFQMKGTQVWAGTKAVRDFAAGLLAVCDEVDRRQDEDRTRHNLEALAEAHEQ